MAYTAEELEKLIYTTKWNNKFGYGNPLSFVYYEEVDVKVKGLPTLYYIDSGEIKSGGTTQAWLSFKVGEQLFIVTGDFPTLADARWTGPVQAPRRLA